MKPKYVKAYQAVYFDSKLHTHFPYKGAKEELNLEVIAGVGVKVTGATDSIFIPYPNIAYIQLEVPVEEPKPKSSSKSSKDK